MGAQWHEDPKERVQTEAQEKAMANAYMVGHFEEPIRVMMKRLHAKDIAEKDGTHWVLTERGKDLARPIVQRRLTRANKTGR